MVVIIVIIVVCCVRSRKRKQRDSRYKLRESQIIEKNRKSKNFEHENIDVISSTPINNTHELMNMYARMDPNRSSKGGSSKSSKTEDDPSTSKEGEQYEDSIMNVQSETSGKVGELYAKVRKPRKRTMSSLNDAFDNVEHVENEDDVTESKPDSGDGLYDNVDVNGDEHVDYMAETNHVYDNAEDVKECSKVNSGVYSRYSAVDEF